MDKLAAGFSSGVNQIPVVGPTLLAKLEELKAARHNVPVEQIREEDQFIRDQNPDANAVGAVVGAVGPFVAAGGVPTAARLLGMTGSLGERVAMGGMSGGVISGADTMARGGDIFDVGKSALFGGGLGAAFPVATRGLAELWRLATGGMVSREAQNVARALSDDKVSPQDIPAKLDALGPDAMIMDLGPNSQSLAGGVASVPGPGQKIVRDAVGERAKNAGNRVADDITATIGDGPEIGALKEGIIAAQKKAADPLYEAVRDIALPNVPDPIRAVMNRPLGQQALRAAVRLAANDGYHFPKDGNLMTVGVADYMKRALDDIATAQARAGNNNVARQARNMAKAITYSVDPLVPGYKAARDAFAGPAQVLDAIDFGSTVFSKEMSPPQLSRELASMSASERDAVIQGAQAQIEALMGNAVNDVATLRNTFKKGWNEGKLRILLGNDIADDLMKRIEREWTFGNTAGVVSSNSETARRQATQGIVDPNLGTTPRVQASIIGLIMSAFDKARMAVQGVRQPKINAGMGNLLSTTWSQLTPATLRQLQLAAKPAPNAMIAPAVTGELVQQDQHPHIVVNGGAR
ncbi:MAG TPA: hypothetical protein VG757_01930 [Devosia sp.]|nr:hypothetical protein [Devosia sp.]